MKVRLVDIKVKDRFRKEFGEISELAESIGKFGLLHPLVIDQDFNLIAGERRLRACESLGWEEVPVTFLDEVDEITAKEIELEENIKRKAFTWVEEVRAKAELDTLKRLKYGETPQGSWEKTGWALADTAKELGQSVGTISQDIQLAKGLELYPELANEKTKGKALNRLKTLRERELREALFQEMDFLADLDLSQVLLYGDCLDYLFDMESQSVDLVVTDPPWGIDINKTQAGESSGRDFYEDDEADIKTLLINVYQELYRILKPGCSAYVCFAIDYYQWHKDMLEAAGFFVDPLPIIWNKLSKGAMTTPYRFSNSYSPWFLCWKEQARRLNLGEGQANVLNFPRVSDKEKNHPAENPRDLLKVFIENSSEPGELVLDPFMGGGSTLISALELRRRILGIEKDPAHYTKAVEVIGLHLAGFK